MQTNGKVCLITGATNGIGRAAAAHIAGAGFDVVLVGRDEARGARTVAEVREKSGNDRVSFLRAELSSVAEVRALADGFKRSHDRLDVLVNNAGAIFESREVTSEGFERTIALNHLAYFVLTAELLPLLRASAPSRIISVASGAHRTGRIRLDDIGLRDGYSAFRAYSQSKLANILFTRDLARRLVGSGVTANSMHPGFVATGFALNNGGFARGLVKLLSPFARSPEKGAETLVHLALSPEVGGTSGEYFYNRRPTKPRKNARCDETARELWELTERMVADIGESVGEASSSAR